MLKEAVSSMQDPAVTISPVSWEGINGKSILDKKYKEHTSIENKSNMKDISLAKEFFVM